MFADARLHRRFADLLRQLAAGVGAGIPQACGDWAAVKAAYRFLANGRVSEAEILGGHLAATRGRFEACPGVVLLVQDTTEFTYRRVSVAAIGVTKSVNSGRDAKGRWRHHTLCGVLQPTSLAVTEDGVPLGITALKVWTRSKFRGTAALKRSVNPTIADAILDRIVHNAQRIQLRGESLRRKKGSGERHGLTQTTSPWRDQSSPRTAPLQPTLIGISGRLRRNPRSAVPP
jgi:hypothetical protein